MRSFVINKIYEAHITYLPLDAVNATLLIHPANTPVKFSILGKDGKILFENIDPGNYLVKLSARGRQDKNSTEIEIK